jgi:peptide deformylase
VSVLPIVYAPDPIFARVADVVSVFDARLASRAEDMLDTLYHHQALGLGSNMLGLKDAVIVVDLDHAHRDPYVMVNPRLSVVGSEREKAMEASLSFPGVRALIERPASIEVAYQDVLGQPQTCAASGLLARVIQHEMDYLAGKTFLDYMGPLKRKWAMQKLYQNKP